MPKLFDPNRKILKRLEKTAEKVLALEDEFKQLSDDELKAKTDSFRERYKAGETLDDLLVEAFATVREASTRVTGLTPFKVQVMGAIVIHEGNISEMKTGEGKTLTAVMPAYLNAIPGEGVHIVTVNEYLAGREVSGEIGELFRFLGLTVGLNVRDITPEEKRAVYNCDIVYSTNNELGFDYLRDHMVIYKENIVQRPLNFAIIDEVDSILIDEARTPLIISGGEKSTAEMYKQANYFAIRLKEEEDFAIDIKEKTVNLTEEGIKKAEAFFNLENLYDISNVVLLHHINNALKANFTMSRDVDYVVHEGKVIIVDPFTGRLMHGRQFSEGLHQALEAKEAVEIKKETTIMATITFQNFFRMYKKLSGMTGTAKTEEEEFTNIYNMYVVEIPTNMPVIRIDDNDLIFATMQAKYKALADEIEKRHNLGQPMLVGTISIESSELLSSLLKRKHIKHDVLNAKQHEREADIVAQAGQMGAVTIATNMAGRGTDIKLGPGVKELGGLAVIGTERHESRRIDNQLRGRSGRQGDPGYSRFFLSGDDDLLRRFGGDRFKSMISMITTQKGSEAELPLDYKMFSKLVMKAQHQIEGNNFDRRKTVLQYDEVMRRQREIIYKQRTDILFLETIEDTVNQMIESVLSSLINHYAEDRDAMYEALNKYFQKDMIDRDILKTEENATSYVFDQYKKEIENKKSLTGDKIYNDFLKAVTLRVVDTYWIQHIDAMSELRQAVSLQSYGQNNPFREYQDTGFQMFEEMVFNIQSDVTRFVLKAQVRQNTERVQVAKPTYASSGKEDENKKKKPVVKSDTTKVGRNDPCPCGSGKKYKYCHGRNAD
ncbi:MAG TPA: preprotein translocase subunit SecA [Bacillota bacterium]|nr:preprotein translocase subunit SecA [Bacillota bacterium]HPF42233.1 preprotein translocase subunit SecA [Bacillota bacterium]HPJ85745.1 preprotein translocase subunit SecA [Bacillota bacterium]HPQ61618.1 preprotein translocase subunit SecA [Bacillota bacterium]